MSARPPRRRPRAAPAPGRLRNVTPEAFEHWVGERFVSLGHAVLRTPFRGDHGVDLNVERQGERAIVQCKHWPARGVGEEVVRSLPVATEQHRLALLRLPGTTPDVALELPTLDGGIRVWRMGYFAPESGAFNPRVRKRAATPMAQPQ